MKISLKLDRSKIFSAVTTQQDGSYVVSLRGPQSVKLQLLRKLVPCGKYVHFAMTQKNGSGKTPPQGSACAVASTTRATIVFGVQWQVGADLTICTLASALLSSIASSGLMRRGACQSRHLQCCPWSSSCAPCPPC